MIHALPNVNVGGEMFLRDRRLLMEMNLTGRPVWLLVLPFVEILIDFGDPTSGTRRVMRRDGPVPQSRCESSVTERR